jgi:hypothetical protein
MLSGKPLNRPKGGMITLLNQWGIGQNEVKNTHLEPSSFQSSVRWWSGQWSGYMGYNTTHPYILPLIQFTCLLFGGVNTYYYICIHIIGIGDDNNPLVVEDIKH